MNKSIYAALALGLTAATPFAFAQDMGAPADTPPAPAPIPTPPPAASADQPENPPPPPPRGKGRGRDPLRAVLAKVDDLTADQKGKIAEIEREGMAKGRELRQDTSLSDDERRDKNRAQMKSTADQVRALLNPDQQRQFDDALATQLHRRGRKKDLDGAGAPPPPPAPPSPPPSDGADAPPPAASPPQ